MVELHTVRPNGSLPDPTHFDRGSLITLDIMLSPPKSFTGGQFSTLNADLSYTNQTFEQVGLRMFTNAFVNFNQLSLNWSPSFH